MRKESFQVTVEFLASIENLQRNIKAVTGDIAKMGSTTGGTQLQKQFDALTQSIQTLQTKAKQPIGSQAEFNKLTSELSRAEQSYGNLISQVQRLHNLSDSKKLELIPEDQRKKIDQAEAALKAYASTTQGASAKAKEFAKQQELLAQHKGIRTTARENVKKYEESLRQATEQIKQLQEQQAQLDSELAVAKKERSSAQGLLTSASKKNDAEGMERYNAQLDAAKQKVAELEAKKALVSTQIKNATDAEQRFTAQLKDAKDQANIASEAIKQIKANMANLDAQGAKRLTEAFDQLKTKARELGVDLQGIDDASSIDELIARMQRLKGEGLQQAEIAIESMANRLNSTLNPALNSTRGELNNAAASFQKFNQQAKEVDQLKSQLSYFFSLTNTVYLFRSALQSAFQTVKELDAVMTETAVVTEFDVGDMWEKLPEYAHAASNLGSSIKDVYAATTLYYQQGLKTNQAMNVGIETMKMARIAGLEAGDATQYMTAALRGFQMEVNETNALKVNDVYSNLAAITAADTAQIATAMSKTASIASAANMEFETTAALLAQIIETTQEAPETAGTALKTIIARFSEVKELQNQGKTVGEDEEGEAIDVNKIETALRTVGISMNDFFNGTEGLDSVLMRLAEKWDTLDFTTQRYIATMAAGSRQQSRFIAMMSDYSRTTELVSAANNSAGASQKQFDKTMESLEAKLAKLKVAWDQFTMNIANDSLIKVGIDLLTKLLETINKLTEKLPGAVKSFANLALVFVGLRTGGALVNKMLSGVSGILSKGLIDAATEKDIIKKATETGAKAGAASTKGMAKGIQASQGELFKSYNLLLFKVQSQLPPVTLKTPVANFKGSESAAKLRAEMGKLKLEMSQVEKVAGKQSIQWQKLNMQYKQMQSQYAAAAGGYKLQGAGLDSLNQKQTRALALAIQDKKLTTEQLALMGPEAAARAADALAAGKEADEIEDLVRARVTEKNLQDGGIKAFFTEIGLRTLNRTTAKGEATGIWQVIKAKIAERIEWVKTNSVMLAGIGVIAIYVAAIALFVVGIIKLKNAWKEAGSESAKALEEMNNSISEFTEQAQEAKNELNEIVDARKGLDDLNEGFSGLTRGTTAWKQQLAEVNQAVLELMTKYPGLAGYITKGQHGQLVIEDAGWEVVSAALEEKYSAALIGQIGAQMRLGEYQEQSSVEMAQTEAAQYDYQYDQYIRSSETQWGWALTGVGGGAAIGAMIGSIIPALGTVIGAGAGALVGGVLSLFGVDIARLLAPTEDEVTKRETGLDKDAYVDFAARAAELGMSFESGTSKAEYKALFEEMGLSKQGYNFETLYDNIRELGADFDSLSASALSLKSAQEIYVDSLVEQIAEGNAGVADSRMKEQIQELVSGQYAKAPEMIQTKAQELAKEDSYVDKKGNLTDSAIAEYANINKMTADEVRAKIADSSLSTETVLTSIATKQVEEELNEALSLTTKALERVENQLINQGKSMASLTRVLSKDGREITQEDLSLLDEAKKKVNAEKGALDLTDPEHQKRVVEEYLASQGTSLGDLQLQGEDDWKIVWNNLNAGVENFAKAVEIQKNLDLNFDDRIGSKAASDFAAQLQNQINFGQDPQKASRISQMAANLTKDLDVEQANLFMEALNAIDWTNSADIENFSQDLADLGIPLEAMRDKVESLEDSVKSFANSTYKLNEQEKADLVDNSAKLINEVLYEGKTLFSEQEYNTLFSEEAKEKMAPRGNFYVFTEDLGPQEIAEYIQGYAQDQLKDDTGERAFEDKTRLTNQTGTSIALSSFAYKTKAQSQGELAALVAGAAQGPLRGFDEYHEAYVLYGQDQNGNSTYQFFDSIWEHSNKDGTRSQTSLEDFVAGATQGELDPWLIYYLTQFKGMTAQDAAEYLKVPENLETAAAELYYKGQGFTKDQRLAFAAAGQEWYTNFAYDDKGNLRNYKDWSANELWKSEYYSWDETQRRLFGIKEDRSEGSEIIYGNTWEVLEQTFGEDSYVNGYEYKGDIGSDIMTNDMLNQLYKTVFPKGAATDPEQQRKELENYYNTTAKNAEGFSEESYFQEFANAEFKDIYTASQSDFYIEADTATQVLTSYVASTSGVSELVSSWKSNNGELINQLNLSDLALQTMALQLNKVQTNMNNFQDVLQNNIEVLSKGPKAGMGYYVALESLTNAMKMAFGKNITQEFVAESLPLLEDLAEGGEEAAKAFIDLAKAQAVLFAQSKGKEELGWSEADQIDYMAAFNKFSEIDWTATPQINLKEWYDQLGLTALSYEEFAYAIAQNPMYATLNIGVRLENGKLISEGSTEDDVVSSFDWRSFFNVGSDGGKETKWENPYDESYNTIQKINQELRRREQLERNYSRLLDRNAATAADIANLARDQLASLEIERADRSGLLAERYSQMTQIESDYSDLKDYANYDEASGQIVIDWNKINKWDGSADEEFTSRLEEYISALEEQQGLIEEELDALEDINDGVWEIFEQGKDEYFDLEDQIKEALVAREQEKIDKLSDINTSINDTNSKILSSMQEQINEYRQARSNEKTEKELEDKQRRLAYLQQDTSGANATEILKLQEEITQGQEDYTDSLIDQKISELQKQNDLAAEQRQQQIDLMQSQLDHYENSSKIWEDVHNLMSRDLDATTGLVTGSELEELLKSKDGFKGMSELGQMNWLNDLNKNVAQALSWLQVGATQSMFGQGKTVKFTNKNGEEVTGTINSEGNVEVKDKDGNVTAIYGRESLHMDSSGNVTSSESGAEASERAKEAANPSTASTSSGNNSSGNGGSNTTDPGGNSMQRAVAMAILKLGGEKSGWGNGSERKTKLAEVFEDPQKVQDLINYFNATGKQENYGDPEDYSYEALSEKAIKYFTLGRQFDTQDEAEEAINTWKKDQLSELRRKVLAGEGGGSTSYYNSQAASIERTANLYRNTIEAKFIKYKTGGLASFTGPAWLDGTKSKPEYVLSADQTKAFFTLVDVLSSLRAGALEPSEKSVDSTYDIDINVESISSDYDVEQMAETIKRLINEDARYRNNNAINLMR